MNFRYYCGVENSICNKNISLNSKTPCCLTCPHDCCNCIVKGNEHIFRCETQIPEKNVKIHVDV